MPQTWTAATIHCLTPPELRALFRVITRKRDRALFLSQRGTPISRRLLDILMQYDGEAAGLPTSKRHVHVRKHSIAT